MVAVWSKSGTYLQVRPAHNALALQTDPDFALPNLPHVLEQAAQLPRLGEVVERYVQEDF